MGEHILWGDDEEDASNDADGDDSEVVVVVDAMYAAKKGNVIRGEGGRMVRWSVAEVISSK